MILGRELVFLPIFLSISLITRIATKRKAIPPKDFPKRLFIDKQSAANPPREIPAKKAIRGKINIRNAPLRTLSSYQ